MAWETYISSLRFASDTALLGAMFRGEIVTPAAAAAAPVGVDDDYAAPMRRRRRRHGKMPQMCAANSPEERKGGRSTRSARGNERYVEIQFLLRKQESKRSISLITLEQSRAGPRYKRVEESSA